MGEDPWHWPAGWAALEAEVVALVNEARSRGAVCEYATFAAAGPLQVDARLTVASRRHSQDMVLRGYFDHVSPEGRASSDRMMAEGYPAVASAENISRGMPTARAVVEGWLGSVGHCANLMNPRYEEVGIGYCPAPDVYGHYWTQTLGRAR